MVEIFSTNTFICIGLTILLNLLLFFYFRKSIEYLENAQREQANILKSFISNVSQQQFQLNQSQGGSSPNNLENYENQESLLNTRNINLDLDTNQDDELINVSDDDSEGTSDENSELDSDEDLSSDNEDNQENEESDDNRESDVINISKEELIENDDVKVISLEVDDEGKTESSEKSLDSLESINIDSEENELEDESIISSLQGSILEEQQSEINQENKDTLNKQVDKINYKSLSVGVLRKMALEKKLYSENEKKTKKQLIELLQAN